MYRVHSGISVFRHRLLAAWLPRVRFVSCRAMKRIEQARFLFPAFLLLFTKWASQSFCAMCHVASKRNATAQFELHVEWGTCEDRECVRRRYFLSRTML
jgi:hypothetical protein